MKVTSKMQDNGYEILTL